MNSRFETRRTARENVTATILGHPDVSVPCSITDFSQAGICLTLGREIAAGSAVKVNWDEHFLVGRVRNISPAGTSYRVGLELLYCSKWSGPMPSGAEL
jgi:hypothetical protein